MAKSTIAINQLNNINSEDIDGNEILPIVEDSTGATNKVLLKNIFYNNSIKTPAIQDGAITENKVEDGAVTENKVEDGAITESKIGLQAITQSKIACNAITNEQINNSCNFCMNSITSNAVSLASSTGTLGIAGAANFKLPTTAPNNRFLIHTTGGQLGWCSITPQGAVEQSVLVGETLPIGAVIPYSVGSVPDNWLECNGDTINISDYPDLFSTIGYNYGGSGSSFKLPNFSGRTIIGEGTGTDLNNRAQTFNMYACGGEYLHPLTINEIPSHCHSLSICGYTTCNGNHSHSYTDRYGRANRIGSDTAQGMNRASNSKGFNTSTAGNHRHWVSLAGQVDDVGGNQSHNNIQPYGVVKYIIKAKKDVYVNFSPTLGPGLTAVNPDVSTNTLKLSSTNLGVDHNNTLEIDANNKLGVRDYPIETKTSGFNAVARTIYLVSPSTPSITVQLPTSNYGPIAFKLKNDNQISIDPQSNKIEDLAIGEDFIIDRKNVTVWFHWDAINILWRII